MLSSISIFRKCSRSAAFRGSHRSAQFLKHIVEQSIAGRFESLKERAIGIELFGRAPSYDTGEDAIVRVTASDVRKRLLQHYGKYGTTSEASAYAFPWAPMFRRSGGIVTVSGTLAIRPFGTSHADCRSAFAEKSRLATAGLEMGGALWFCSPD